MDECEQASLSFFAVYENAGEKILISEDGVFLPHQNVFIHYSGIKQATCWVNDDVLLDGVMVYMKDGSRIKIEISGRDESNRYDAHSFVRFLMRTLEDRSVN